MRTLASLAALFLVALLVQSEAGAKPKSKAAKTAADYGDGGDAPLLLGPDPPGVLRRETSDAGAPAAQAKPDAGPSAQQQQLDQLKARIDQLQQQVATNNAAAQQLADANAQLQALRDQLAQDEANRRAREQQNEARKAQVQGAISGLVAAQQSLAGGNADIADALDQASASFTGQAARDLAVAREALRNGDLSQARAYLSSAINDAQSGR